MSFSDTRIGQKRQQKTGFYWLRVVYSARGIWRILGRRVGLARGRRLAGMILLAAWLVWPATGEAVEMCTPRADELMRKSGISERQIKKLCGLVKLTAAPFVISLHRTEEELGYCRVTLALQNRSAEYLNQLALSTRKSLFEIFQFHNVLPGTVAYASARSKILLACDELEALRLTFHWPASLRVGDKAAQGARLQRYQPILNGSIMGWAGDGERRKNETRQMPSQGVR